MDDAISNGVSRLLGPTTRSLELTLLSETNGEVTLAHESKKLRSFHLWGYNANRKITILLAFVRKSIALLTKKVMMLLALAVRSAHLQMMAVKEST